MSKLIIANWKTNPLNIAEGIELAKASDFPNVVICPPFPFLNAVGENLTNASLGTQDVFWGNLGPYTGEVSWRQLLELGVKYVIIGHSERRIYLKETDELINNKLIAALNAELKVILCVGEPREIRDKGINAAKNYVEQQLDKDLIGIENCKLKNENLLIAYEPIWAIGTGISDKLEDTIGMASFIKTLLASRYSLKPLVLYGGSVNAANAKEILSAKEIDGALVGGASLKPEEFQEIVKFSTA